MTEGANHTDPSGVGWCSLNRVPWGWREEQDAIWTRSLRPDGILIPTVVMAAPLCLNNPYARNLYSVLFMTQ